MAKHGSMAGFSLCMFLIYCDYVSRSKGEKMTIVAALTDGSNNNIRVGRNAVFYDRDGNDWDATIVKIIENPVSIKEAFWSPYKKLGRFISEQIQKFAAKKDKEVMEDTAGKIEATGEKLATADLTTPVAPACCSGSCSFRHRKICRYFRRIKFGFGSHRIVPDGD